MIGRVRERLLLSRAKHPSVRGHAKWSQRLAKLVPYYEHDEATFFEVDGAPPGVTERRRAALERLGAGLRARAPRSLALGREVSPAVSDMQFVNAYRVPYPFRAVASRHLEVAAFVSASDGARVCDLDGNWSYDLGGDYGVNLFGHEFYKGCLERGLARTKNLGLVLGSYHPVLADNVARLCDISGLDEVSFHMSGTEAVMQAVRLARYHTRRSHVVRFCGAYHGWWDGVQAGVGNPRPPHEVYTLAECSETTLHVLATRNDIACVLVNPIQALYPNGSPPSDSSLVTGARRARFDKDAYTRWLVSLREVCTKRGIALVIDDVFMGFRLARGGSQEYFGVRADLVTYGKTLGGGLPVGVLCGTAAFMRRFREDRPVDVCFARGTFNSHPVVMATMNEFLRSLETEPIQSSYRGLEARWDGRREKLDAMLAARGLPVRFANMTSVWTTLFETPGRYHWMLQYYLRAEGLSPSWIGTGRFIFSHDLSDEDFDQIATRIVRAVEAMRDDGFLWHREDATFASLGRDVALETLKAVTMRALGLRQSPPRTPPVAPGSGGAAAHADAPPALANGVHVAPGGAAE